QALEGQMNDAERRLKQFLAKHDIVDAETQIKLLAADEIEQEKGLQAHLAKISALRKKAETVRAQLAKTPEQIAWGQEYTTNPTMLTYKNRLADLQLSRASVAQRYLATDRHVQDFDNQIADVKARMRGEEEKLLSKQTMRTSLLNMDLKRGVFSMEALLSDAEARKPDLWRRLKTTQKRLKTLRQLSFQVANLQEEADRKKYAYQLYWKKHEEARATEAMSSQSMVSVSVVDRAVPPIDPQNPPWIPLVLGLFAGLVLGTATAVAVEFLNRRLRFEQEVEHYLELPVLAIIPDLAHVPNRARGGDAEGFDEPDIRRTEEARSGERARGRAQRERKRRQRERRFGEWPRWRQWAPRLASLAVPAHGEGQSRSVRHQLRARSRGRRGGPA